MQELSPLGLSKDGKRLVLVSASGEEFAVPVDHRLRAALRGDQARHGKLEMKMESALRPRDIQARIRAGESPEQVAAAAQTTVQAIMGFATPVLAERAHIAQTAQKSSVRRRSAESSSAARTLGDAAAAHLAEIGVAEDEVRWDSWRRDDGRWALVADFRDQRAEFSYDLPGRYVTAENDHARLLTGERRPAGRAQAGARRLSAVPDQDELPLGDDAIELVRERDETAAAEDGVEEPSIGQQLRTAEPEERVAAVPASEERAAEERAADEGSAEEPLTGKPPTVEPSAEDPFTEGPSTGEPSTGEPATEEPVAGTVVRPRRKGRASVPSWDEIMFGSGKGE